MSKVLYSATVSLDGYMAGPNGDMSWLRPYLASNPPIDELQEQIRALLMGANTFYGDDPNRGTDAEGAFNGTWSGPSFVITHRPHDPIAGANTTFCSDVASAMRAARTVAGEDYVNVLGAEVARQCLQMSQLDEVLMIVAPVILGSGTPFLNGWGARRTALTRTHVDVLPHVTNLWFRVDH